MNWWQQPYIARAINAYLVLNEREKILAKITINALLVFIFIFFLIEPFFSSAVSQQDETSLLKAENSRFEQQLQELQNTPVIDPNQVLRDQIEALEAESQNIQLRIANLTDALVSPENMVEILEQMLTQDQRLKVTSLVSMPKEQIELEEGDGQSLLFRHGLKITVTATYPSLVAYLKRLDALKWRVYWQSLEYKVSRYPKGELTLEVYTLSTREEVLGA